MGSDGVRTLAGQGSSARPARRHPSKNAPTMRAASKGMVEDRQLRRPGEVAPRLYGKRALITGAGGPMGEPPPAPNPIGAATPEQCLSDASATHSGSD